jgi:hypothetical protein
MAYWRSVLSTAPIGASIEGIRSWGSANRIDLRGDERQDLFAFVETLPDSFPCSKQEIEVKVLFDKAGRSASTDVVSRPTCL